MANFEKFAGKLLHLEGGFVNNPLDKGGPTKYGVILSTWKEYGHDKDGDSDIDIEDIKLLTEQDARDIAKKIFWDYFQADKIVSQSVAEFIVDWGYNSGRKTVALIVQRLLYVEADGQFGKVTLSVLNTIPQQSFFEKLKAARTDFINGIVARKPDQKVFYKGWMNRIKSFQFTP